ncbi:MAG: tRNA wybutosine-synthesizing 3 family protein [Candidatus Nanoarchaeia archaeon]|nr:tRNA wybutosine-synthesizing 3 family protein [Candidatus Nanoarchaeia archaeon]
MGFEKDKKEYVSILEKNIEENKKDKSRKGFVDKEILNLVNLINSIPEFYTTSSCAGRILIMGETLSGIKKDTIWYLATHDYIKKLSLEDQIFQEMKKNKNIGNIKQESAILHVCAKDLESAQKILDIAKFVGFKHSGIMATKKRIMIEIMSSEKIDVPIYNGKELLISQDYLNFIIDYSNKSLKKTRIKIDKFEKKLKEQYNI